MIYFIPQLTPDLICIFALILGIGSAFFYPAKMAAVTNIVNCSRLKFANALISPTGAAAFLFGAFWANSLANYSNIKAFGTILTMYLISAFFIALKY